jgi:uroporphyrinogen III methyltransferase/synthase
MNHSPAQSGTGKVYLVGAGPGDPGLITLKGLELLKQADVVIYDRLASDVLLKQVKPGSELIYAGKSPDKHTLTQSSINELLALKAAEGKMVVRLKGGDPFVLGRGAEEAEHLVSRGIPFEIVPGITAAIAVPAYAGIPVTHRSYASSFAVITGHEDPGKEDSSIHWEKLATAIDTLVFLMAVGNMASIASQLIRAGRSPDTPVAVIQNGTHPQQKSVTCRLDEVASLIQAGSIIPPAVMVVGDVVRCRAKLAWFDNQPLFGKRILVTRARQQAGKLSQLLIQRGAIAIELPTIAIKPVADNTAMDQALLHLSDCQWLVFTSVNGVEAFRERLNALGMDSRQLAGLKIGAIGPATAEALKALGFTADYIPAEFTGRGFVAGLKPEDIRQQRFLLIRSDIADAELPEGILKLGGEVSSISAYTTSPDKEAIASIQTLLAKEEIDVITFSSSSTVTSLVAPLQTREQILPDDIVIACIGPKTAQTARAAGLKVAIEARECTIPGLVKELEHYFTKERN